MLKIEFPSYNYLDFVSVLLDISKDNIQTFKPCRISQKMLSQAYKDSISPSTGETVCSFEEAFSLYLVTRILKPKVVVETGFQQDVQARISFAVYMTIIRVSCIRSTQTVTWGTQFLKH